MKRDLYRFIVLICSMLFTTHTVTAQDLEITICDDDGDGYSVFNIETLENYVLQNIGEGEDSIQEQVLISTSEGNVYSIDSPSNNPSISVVCIVNDYSVFTDIAVNSSQDLFVCDFGSIYAIDDDCNIFEYDYPSTFNALSFDDLDNLYTGSGLSSQVTRFNISSTEIVNAELWHDFQAGSSGGDFVLLNDKMYVAWSLNFSYRLYEVTVNSNRDYVSHIDLGELPFNTYGLASELGKLYGVTPNKLYQINLPEMTFTDVIQNPNTEDSWYGAAGLHEAVPYTLSTHLTLNDAENGEGSINGDWTNTVQGGQILYIRVENSVTGTYEIVLLNIIIYSYPNLNVPEDLVSCFDEVYNVFNLSQVATQMQIDTNDNLAFIFYNTDPETSTNAFPLAIDYQSTMETETLFVSVDNNESGCIVVYSFQVINKESPSVLPISNVQAPTTLGFCYFDSNEDAYFDLNDIENTIILEEGNYETSFYLSYIEALNDNNEIATIYYVESSLQEIFIRVENELGCFEISNFFLDGNCTGNTNFYFPLFVTPNGDGFNDYWNVKGATKDLQNQSIIKIFDRYGKELMSFRPSSRLGWDGTYNGKRLPASDYWFTFNTTTGIEKVGHFTLRW